ncbi:lipase [Penicillium lagena]|uniref:lipase n=1 Tax=Penicillium lagena TaxID=94218 RepID=UPI002540F50D|nr:lipase [Penicillium lagena]KAJ5625745.1 lipase [Penicillium lagena]
MMFHAITTLSVGMACVSQAYSIPTLQSRATAGMSAFPELQRAADLSSAAYTGCTGSAFDVTITKQINDAITDTQGFVGYSTSKKRISVVMRGSTTTVDIANDIDTTLVVPSLSGVQFPSGVQIMQGIYSPWSSVHTDVISAVASLIEQYPDYTLESTGHSLGGSLTYLSYVALAQNFPDKQITSNAMAAFPIGNAAWANFGSSQNGTLNRGNNIDDGVPNMYVSAPYNFVHYGTVRKPHTAEYQFAWTNYNTTDRNTTATAPLRLVSNALESGTRNVLRAMAWSASLLVISPASEL